jgi:electron transfer flavoprotein alpha subunit
MLQEVWSFIEAGATSPQKTAAGAASEAARLADMLGGLPCGVLVAAEDSPWVQDLANFGLRKIYTIEANARTAWTPEVFADALVELILRYRPRLLVLAATALGNDIAARVSTHLGLGVITDCVDFSRDGEALIARKAISQGKAHLTATWNTPPPHLATVDPEALEAIERRGSAVLDVVRETVSQRSPKTELLSRWKTDPRLTDLREASFVIGVGRPLIDRPSELETLRASAESCGAAFGVSRPVVDAGVIPKERQIGASGNWLSADVYIACGISGSSYHMMGVRQVRHLIAVNIDPNAPIMRQAELAIVADLFQVLPALAELVTGDREAATAPKLQRSRV